MLVFNSTHAACGAALAALLLAACGKSPPAPAPKIATSTVIVSTKRAPQDKPAAATSVARAAAAIVAPAAVPPAASTAFGVTAVTLGSAVDNAHNVTQPGTHFTPTEKTIYASVVTTGSAPDVALSARWNYLEGAGMLITSVTQRLASEGPATTTFTLQNPDLWPEGKYNVEIAVDGKVVNTQAFTIGK